MLRQLSRPEAPPPWSFTGALGALIAMFASMVIGSTLAGTLLADSPTVLLTGWSIGAVLTMLFVMAGYHRQSAEHAAALRLGQTKARLPLVLLFALGMAITFDLLSQIVTGDFSLTAPELATLRGADVTVFGWLIALLFMV